MSFNPFQASNNNINEFVNNRPTDSDIKEFCDKTGVPFTQAQHITDVGQISHKQLHDLNVLIRNNPTDSDIKDFCEENDLPLDRIQHLVDIQNAPKECKACLYVGNKHMHPCVNCSRNKSDQYKNDPNFFNRTMPWPATINYRGFRMPNHSISSMMEFIDDVRSLTMPALREAYNTSLCDACKALITTCIDLDTDFDGSEINAERIASILCNWYVQGRDSYSYRIHPQEQLLKAMNSAFGYEIYNFVNDMYGRCFPCCNDLSFTWNDCNGEIKFMKDKTDPDYILIIPYGRLFENAFTDLLNNKDFCSKYGFKEYHYFSNEKRPDHVSKEEWAKRYDAWSTADINNKSIKVLDTRSDKLFDAFTALQDEHIFDKYISVAEIAKYKAEYHTIEYFRNIDTSLRDLRLMQNKEPFGPSHTNGPYEDRLNSADPAMIAYMTQLINDRCKILNGKSTHQILCGTIFDLMPKYKKFLTEKGVFDKEPYVSPAMTYIADNWVVDATFEDGTKLKKIYPGNISEIVIRHEISNELTKIFGNCLILHISHNDTPPEPDEEVRALFSKKS